VFSSPAVAGELAFIGSCNGVVHAIDTRTGQARWTYNALQDGGKRAEFHGNPVAANDLIIFGSDDRNPGGIGHIYAFEQATGKVRWKYRAGAGVMADIVRHGDRVYAVTLQDELVCLDLSSGQARWTFASGWVNERMTNVMAAPAVADGRVFFGGQNGVVHAMDASSGRLAWKREVGAPVVTPLVLAHDAVYFGTFDQRIHRLGLTAERHAELGIGGIPFGPPTLQGDSLLVLVYDKPDSMAALKSLDLALKHVRWSRDTSSGWSSVRPFLWHGSVLAGSDEGRLVAFSPDGSQKWSGTVSGTIRGIGLGDQTLYVGTQKGTVYAYRPIDGRRSSGARARAQVDQNRSR
jgi:outer membrane protein assembly factor BamB